MAQAVEFTQHTLETALHSSTSTVRYALVIAFSLMLAGDLHADDPFSAYHDSIDLKLSGILKAPKESAGAPAERPRTKVGSESAVQADEIVSFAKTYWSGHEARLAPALARLQRLRPEMERILESQGVPKQFIAIVLIESAADPYALSPKSARGLWQLMPETARQYGLVVNAIRDDRLDLTQATRAAALFLRDLYQRFGDWSLALAAYNAGPEAVDRALNTVGKRSFSVLSSARKLPAETRTYVPAVLAATRLLGGEHDEAPPASSRFPATVYATTSVYD